jgi:EAL domain-containing protein (putative c-di-GMP-specific phosphodiesterase class I)
MSTARTVDTPTDEQAVLPGSPGEIRDPAFSGTWPEVGSRFEADGALGLILIDASALSRLEELAGPASFRRSFDALMDQVRVDVAKVLGEPFPVTSGPYDDEHILVFVHRNREERAFYAEGLPAAAGALREVLEGQLRRVVYPYRVDPSEFAVGHGFGLWRTFQRPEAQLRKLVHAALASAHFERERLRQETRVEFERILLEERISPTYEPIVRLCDGSVVGFEGLARGPQGSRLHSPMALFKTAEIWGLDYELDCLCRRLALEGARGLPGGVKLFLNCLPAAVHDPMFQASRIREALEATGIAPADLVLEISERQAIASYAVFRDAIAYFDELGVGIAVDDMGAGYSSLATALELRPGFLKIDRSLISGIDDDPPRREMVRAIQVLAERTDAVVVAEGIERQEELEVLLEIGVDCGQGFLFGREE